VGSVRVAAPRHRRRQRRICSWCHLELSRLKHERIRAAGQPSHPVRDKPQPIGACQTPRPSAAPRAGYVHEARRVGAASRTSGLSSEHDLAIVFDSPRPFVPPISNVSGWRCHDGVGLMRSPKLASAGTMGPNTFERPHLEQRHGRASVRQAVDQAVSAAPGVKADRNDCRHSQIALLTRDPRYGRKWPGAGLSPSIGSPPSRPEGRPTGDAGPFLVC